VSRADARVRRQIGALALDVGAGARAVAARGGAARAAPAPSPPRSSVRGAVWLANDDVAVDVVAQPMVRPEEEPHSAGPRGRRRRTHGGDVRVDEVHDHEEEAEQHADGTLWPSGAGEAHD
jgi:hypothetical protein